MTLVACTPSSKAYLGPTLSMDDVGVVAPAIDDDFRKKSIIILQINGQDKLGEWSTGSQPVHLLPGEYQFTVEFHQLTSKTTIPIVDLVTMIQDVSTAAEHDETVVVFPVRAGQTHRLHYDEASHVFSVSLLPGVALNHYLPPTPDAVACVSDADRTAAFWCALASQVE